jgi:pilus assembly protein CpaC
MDRNTRTRRVIEARSVCAGPGLLRVACVLAGWLLLSSPMAWAQQSDQSASPPTISQSTASYPQPVRLPNVPLKEPRPAEGDEVNQRWQTEVPDSTPPVARFVEPLRGNDAVISLIVGQARLLTLRTDLTSDRGKGVIAVADPSVVDFDILPNPRLIRLTARRVGVTDLSIVSAAGEIFNFEIHVTYDLDLLNAQMKQIYPDLHLRLFQLREHVVVEGQVRSIRQADQVLNTIELVLQSLQVPTSAQTRDSDSPQRGRADSLLPQQRRSGARTLPEGEDDPVTYDESDFERGAERSSEMEADSEWGTRPTIQVVTPTPQIINLLRVPGVHQVMLRVQIAELNRTAMRNIGADWNVGFNAGSFLETLVGGPGTTVSGVFPSADLEFVLRALRQNALLSVLAEPNLVAMSGQKASFLAGGEFPIPVPQNVGGGTTVTIEFKQFGVQLDFIPYILEDETIRLTVSPEESSPDFASAVEIDGYFVPGINTRRASTTVEMRPGQTLALAGLLRVSVDANTRRIPGLGDLPYIGPLFSNTTHSRQEKELVVLVTPHLVAPMDPDVVPHLPTDGLTDPNDLEFYFLNRIEGRTGREFHATREWDDPWKLRHWMHLEQSGSCGPVGFSSIE